MAYNRTERNDVLDELYEDEDFDDFEDIDTFFYDNDNLGQCMNDYVKKHAAGFVVNGNYPYSEF